MNVAVADEWTMMCFASRLYTAPAAARDALLDYSWRYYAWLMQVETGERRVLWTRIGTPKARLRLRP